MAIDSDRPLLAQISHAVDGTHDVAKNGATKNDVTKMELYADLKKFDVDFKRFYGIEPKYVDRRFVIELSELSYLPKVLPPLPFGPDL